MGNLSKSYGKYDLSIKYYSDLLSKVNQNSILYSDILYRRGGSYERSGDYKKADLDLLKSLELKVQSNGSSLSDHRTINKS